MRETIRYKSDASLKQLKVNVKVIGSYLFLIWLWQFTLSYQSSFYAFMNFSVFMMWVTGTLSCFFSKEEVEGNIKHTKNQIFYYLIVTFVYDLLLRFLFLEMMSPTGAVDPSLTVAKQFLTVTSTMIKIGFPVSYVIWAIQKVAVYRGGMSKSKQIENLRNMRKVNKEKMRDGGKETFIDKILDKL